MANQVDICNLAFDILGADPITSLGESTKEAALASRQWAYALDEVLRAHPWNFARKTVELEYTTGYGIYATADQKDITAITQANPPVLTVTSHGWETDYTIKIADVLGMTQLNQRIFKIEKLTEHTFSLPDINATVFDVYASGGKAIRYEPDPDFQNGYTYDLPLDYLCDPRLDGHPKHEFEIVGWDDGTKKTRRLLTTVEDAVLEYTANILTGDVAKYPVHFINALAATLARRMHRSLSKKGAKSFQEIWAEYNAVMAEAKLADTRESKEKEGNYTDPILEAGGFE